MEPLLLVLDLDETLVYATETPMPNPPDFRLSAYYIYRRPHLDSFLAQTLSLYRVAIWTASGAAYADEVINAILPDRSALAFMWSREKCTKAYDFDLQTHYYIKDLKKVFRQGYRKERVVIIDDSPEKVKRQYGNHIRLSEWKGDPTDTELLLLPRYLALLNGADNVRLVEKRSWKSKVS